MNETVSTAIPAETETTTYTRTEKLLAVLCALLAILFVEFAVMSTLGFITTGVYVLLITVSVIWLRRSGCRLTGLNIAMCIGLYLFSAVFSITDNSLIKFLDSVFLFVGGAYFVYSAAEGRRSIERYLPFAMIKALFEFPLSRLGTQVNVARSTVKSPKASSNIRNVILGMLLAFPLTMIVGALLISADGGLEHFFNDLFTSDSFAKLFKHLFRVLFAVPCSFYLFGLLYSNVKRDKLNVLDHDLCWKTIEGIKAIPNAIFYTAVTPICILYVMFFISQASYFLSAFIGELPAHYSYAEYARRGFFELCFVTMINLGVIIFMSLFSRDGGKEKPKLLKLYTTFLSLSTLVLIAVALSKMIMYISRYGLTRLRLYTSWFMVLCAIVFVLVIIKQFRFELRFSSWLTLAFTVMFGLLCFGQTDHLIAVYNIEMYNAGYLKQLDKYAILELSDDAVLTAYMCGITDDSCDDALVESKNSELIQRMNIPSLILYSKVKDMPIQSDEFRVPNI